VGYSCDTLPFKLTICFYQSKEISFSPPSKEQDDWSRREQLLRNEQLKDQLLRSEQLREQLIRNEQLEKEAEARRREEQKKEQEEKEKNNVRSIKEF
jgi:hypothetical protein